MFGGVGRGSAGMDFNLSREYALGKGVLKDAEFTTVTIFCYFTV